MTAGVILGNSGVFVFVLFCFLFTPVVYFSNVTNKHGVGLKLLQTLYKAAIVYIFVVVILSRKQLPEFVS